MYQLRTCSRCGRTYVPLAEYDENDDPPGPISVIDDQIVCRRCVTAWEELMVKGELCVERWANVQQLDALYTMSSPMETPQK